MYRYFGFISYSHKDDEAAAFLQAGIEQYRIPNSVRKEKKIQKIFPLFRDKTDAVGGNLQTILYGELAASAHLLVLCSVNSAKSDWVNREVNFFLQHGREKDIIPVVIGNREEDVFPPAILQTPELVKRSICFRKSRDREAVVQVAARILEADESLFLKAYRRKRRASGAVAACLTMAGLAGAACGLWYLIPHAKYFSSVTFRNELPVGVDELDSKERQAVDYCYRIITRMGKIRELDQVNSSGELVSVEPAGYQENRPSIRYYYDTEGQLKRTETMDSAGKPFEILQFSNNGQEVEVLSPVYDGESASKKKLLLKELYPGYYEELPVCENEISRIRRSYDDDGTLLQEQYYYNNFDTPIPDENGMYGRQYAWNTAENTLTITGLDREGNPSLCESGEEGPITIFRFNEAGRTVLKESRSADGNVLLASQEYIYDDKGRSVRLSSVEGEQEAVEKEFSYDAQGFLCERMERKGLDEKSMILNRDEKHRVQDVRLTNYDVDYDGLHVDYKDADTVRIHFVNEQGEDVVSSDAEPYTAVEIHNEGQLTVEGYYDTSGALKLEKRTEFFVDGNTKRVSFYDAEGNPAEGPDSVSEWQYEYDEAHRLTRITFFDAEGERMKSSDGYASVKYSYDSFGNQSSEAFYDENDLPTFTCQGYYHREEREYDEDQALWRCTLYNKEGEPIDYVREVVYDPQHRCGEVRYLNEQNRLAQGKEGYAFCEIRYDLYGKEVERRFYDAEYEELSAVSDWTVLQKRDTADEELMCPVVGNPNLHTGNIMYQDLLICIGEWSIETNPAPELLSYELEDSYRRDKIIQVLRCYEDGGAEILRFRNYSALSELQLEMEPMTDSLWTQLVSARSSFDEIERNSKGMLASAKETDYRGIENHLQVNFIESHDIPVFGHPTLRRDQIYSIRLLNSLENVGKDAWDVSEMQDGSVVAWVTPKGKYYDLYLAAEGGVKCSSNGSYLFAQFDHAVEIDLGEAFDTSAAENLDYLFYGCKELEQLYWKQADTGNVNSMQGMFSYCESIEALPTEELQTNHVKDMYSMFYACSSLKTLDLSHFDTSDVTDMSDMFCFCEELKTLDLSTFDTSGVKNMSSMFFACSGLESLDVSAFDTSQVADFSGMFQFTALRDLDLRSFDIGQAESLEDMFLRSSELTGLQLGSAFRVRDDMLTEDMFCKTPYETYSSEVFDIIAFLSSEGNLEDAKSYLASNGGDTKGILIRMKQVANHPDSSDWMEASLMAGAIYQAVFRTKKDPRDFVDSEKWMRRSAESGDFASMMMLGRLYEEGIEEGLAEPSMALEWYQKLLDLGYQQAQEDINRVEGIN